MILHAREAAPPGGGEAGAAPVVLLHGLFGQARNFGTIQRALAPRARVIALDARNHGDSPHAAGMTYAEQAEDVHETLAALGALPCLLVGHSMGGKTAMRLALDHPADVRRLLVADVAPRGYQPHFRRHIAAMQALDLTPGMTRAGADAALAAAEPDPGVRGLLLQNLMFGPAPAWRIGLDAIAAGIGDIEGWSAPTGTAWPGPCLFLTGARSDYVREDDRPAIRALFPAARFVTLKGAGHWLHADNPNGFLAVLEAFIR
ncbi:alpha/beta fold hydrolase [Acidisphaera rubrifaciens]|uniref:Hydrolase/esterase/lipase n=1 Tax=Acidisphaera rubrifaciens HS-AP3 TaxID=1231350 RepID=A0A0D6P941_9PROT|nr:alpha/beta fold hydrolase [Acidisphaera rubrifaciens]GAN78172.1 hydrolase/esterase/lipase [Acidisphaera rubrifaciens HS-AP3]